LTIDDGYKSVFDILPITKKYKIPVILFILADSKKANREELETDEELLSWDDIKLLQNEGWEIGCHSSTHPKFPALSKMQIEEEIISSKKIIEKRLGNKISFFAYPKGAFSNRIKQFVKLAGYKYAFSVLPGRITKKTDLYSIPRTIIDQTHSWYDFPALYSKSWLIFRRITQSLKLWERFLT
jgi:peptidoglycan/xylan/chitin deacetylase (PgdA/CDA1 family)